MFSKRIQDRSHGVLVVLTIKKLKEKVGELVIDLDIIREAVKNRPFDPRCVRRPNGNTYIGRLGTPASANGTPTSVIGSANLGQMERPHR